MHTPQPVSAGETASTYRKLRTILTSRAARLGSRDAEGAAHEALRRSFENPRSREALEYYIQESVPVPVAAPRWSLAELLAWLHGILRHVVQEERGARASHWREVLTADGQTPDVRDAATDPLESLIDGELRTIVRECLSTLSGEYRQVLELRYWEGLKYAEIAVRLGLNENTVATRMSRGTEALSRRVLERLERAAPGSGGPGYRP